LWSNLYVARRWPLTPFDPAAEYESRRAARAATAGDLARRERLAGRARIGAFLALVALFVFLPSAHRWWLLPATAPFVVAVVWHRQIVRRHDRARREERYFSHGLARLRDEWPGRGPAGDPYADPKHPYSGDLDVFGKGSLYQYLCAAHTPAGQDMLADWLSQAADPATVQARQAAVAELKPAIDLREAHGLLGNPEKPDLKARALLDWTARPTVLSGRGYLILSVVLGVLAVIGAVLWAEFGTGPSPFLLVVIVEVIVLMRLWSRMREVTGEAGAVLEELTAFLPVLSLVERQRFTSPLLKGIGDALTADGESPAARVARLGKLLDWWNTCLRNQAAVPFAIALMAPVHLAYAIDWWRRRDGQRVRGWVGAVAEFETLVSFSAFGYEHPDAPFPEIIELGPQLRAEDLAHPLLPASRRVANDVAIGPEPALLLVSGSNMSGKSTLMRAVGLNVVLALAGAPVIARRLVVSPLAVATAMRQGDSLHDGLSAFGAEIRRLQAIRELAKGPRPVLFLLDEILRGTNSHDRRIGAEAVIKVLLNSGGIGMVSTHDLALAEIVDRLGPKAANVHFEDQIADNRVSFDYRLRPGVVPRGNGLVLLRLLGFEV
jgi:hypothetical protein